MSRSQLFGILVVGYVLTLVLSLEVFGRLVEIGHYELSAGVLPFPLTYFFLDIAAEILGYRYAKRMILIGVSAIIVLGLLQYLFAFLPSSRTVHPVEAAYWLVNRHDLQFVMTGSCAILAADFFNAKLLTHLKLLTQGRHFALRSFVSTVGGEAINTILAFGIGFLGLLSHYHLVELVLSCFMYKCLVSLILNPPTVLVVYFLKSRVVHNPFLFATFNPFHFEKDSAR